MKEGSTVTAEGKFYLRAWEYTNAKCNIILILLWNCYDDNLQIKIYNFKFDTDKVTKQSIMSAANSKFDPIGIMSLFNVGIKLL